MRKRRPSRWGLSRKQTGKSWRLGRILRLRLRCKRASISLRYTYDLYQLQLRLYTRPQTSSTTIRIRSLRLKHRFIKPKRVVKTIRNPARYIRRWCNQRTIYKHWWTSIFLYFPFYTSYDILKHRNRKIWKSWLKVRVEATSSNLLKRPSRRKYWVRNRRTAVSFIGKKQKKAIKYERQNLRYLHNLKSRHKSVTTHILKLQENSKVIGYINYLTLRLEHVIIQLGFVTILRQARNLIKTGYILVNGVTVYDPLYLLNVGDRIQMVLDYSTDRKRGGWALEFKKLIRHLGKWRKARKKTDRLYFTHKFPWGYGWSITHLSAYYPLSLFLEVDYEIMTGIVLYKPTRMADYSALYLLQYPFNYITLYNWKYYY